MKISIVIPTYNEEKFIGKSLECIGGLATNDWEVEVMIIDAKSTDRTKEIAKSYGARVVDIEHRGIGFARQQGIKYATGDIIAYTDADTCVPKDWLVRYVEVLTKPQVVFAYGPFKVVDGTFPYYHFINYIQFYGWWLFSVIFRLPLAAGQNLAFWKKKAQIVGGFNVKLRLMEDNDLSLRMSKIGKVVFLWNLVVYSSGRRSKEGWGFFFRTIRALIDYFVLGHRTLQIFPDFR